LGFDGGWGPGGGQLLRNSEGLGEISCQGILDRWKGKALEGTALGKFAWGGLGGLQRASPQWAGSACRFASGGGGWGGVESAQVGEKAEEKHLMRRGIGFGLETIVVRSQDGYRQWLGTGHHSCEVF
jgi:hypothetical protein